MTAPNGHLPTPPANADFPTGFAGGKAVPEDVPFRAVEGESERDMVMAVLEKVGAPIVTVLDERFAQYRKWREAEAEKEFFDRTYSMALPVLLSVSMGQQTPEQVLNAIEQARVTAQGIAERAVLKRRESVARDFREPEATK